MSRYSRSGLNEPPLSLSLLSETNKQLGNFFSHGSPNLTQPQPTADCQPPAHCHSQSHTNPIQSNAYLRSSSVNLTFMEPCIARCVFYVTNEMHLYNPLYYYQPCTCFGRFFRPSSGAYKTVSAALGIVMLFCCLPLVWMRCTVTQFRKIFTAPLSVRFFVTICLNVCRIMRPVLYI